MKATLILYIVMGALFLVPLILFNIRRIFVRKPPAPLKINWGRGLFVVLFSAFLVFFLVCAYRTTMESRYEIAAERIAEQHASMLAGNQSAEDFRHRGRFGKPSGRRFDRFTCRRRPGAFSD